MLFSSYLTRDSIVLGTEVLSVSFVIYLIALAIYRRTFHPYKDFPGPWIASITPLWYWRAVRFARAQDHQLPIHQKYGSMVRISPDQIQISDPAALEVVYGAKNVFPKAEFYEGFNPHISPRRGAFEEQDEKLHGIRRRIVAPLYTQSSILEFEPCVDRLIALFYRQMETFESENANFDMSVWLRKYTFDVVGEIFYGRKGGFGFIRDNIDYNNWCKLMETMPQAASSNTYVPHGLRTLFFAAEMISPETRVGAVGFFDTITQSHKAVAQRLEDMKTGKHKAKHDMLTKLLDLVNDSPDPKVHFTHLDVTEELWTMIWAGGDTTAIALTSIFYHLHKHPNTLQKLRNEIDHAFATGELTYPLRYWDCVKLPYLHAVVRESMRIHGSLGTGLPRIVPKGGATICGKFFPEGYGVIMNGNAVNFDKGVFGQDADQFIPERWIRDGDRKAAEMERNMMQFGHGPRVSPAVLSTILTLTRFLFRSVSENT
jgi:cytochrome P450